MLNRVVFSVILFLSIFFAPFWLSALLALIGIILFNYFWEAPILLLLIDLLYGVPLNRYELFPFVGLATGIFVLLVAELIKQKTRFN